MTTQGYWTNLTPITAELLNAGLWDYGPLALRPIPGLINRIYIGSDTGLFYRDTGVSWEVLLGLKDAEAHVPSQRSLGIDPLQAAAGKSPSRTQTNTSHN